MKNRAYLSLGANIEPEKNIVEAVALLAEQTELIAASSVWETLPVGLVDQPNFLNASVIVKTKLSASMLKNHVLTPIEDKLGRTRSGDKFGPRTIDIDIVLFNSDIFELGHRHIPDIEIVERPFIAITLAEIAPDYIHPETGQTLLQIAETIPVPTDSMKPHLQASQDLQELLNNPDC